MFGINLKWEYLGHKTFRSVAVAMARLVAGIALASLGLLLIPFGFLIVLFVNWSTATSFWRAALPLLAVGVPLLLVSVLSKPKTTTGSESTRLSPEPQRG